MKGTTVASNPQSWTSRNHFALRRLHSLSGIVPVGVFLIVHLLTNSTAFLGAENFNEEVGWIHAMPWLLAVEILFIFIPIAFHGGYGVVIALSGKSNARQYPYMDNWRYTLQRVTAWITVVFILVHLAHFRFAHWFGGTPYGEASPEFFAFTKQGFLSVLPLWLWLVVYSVGLVAAVFHFCNGIVTFCITWGITVGDQSRKRVSAAAGVLGVVLLFWGFVSLYTFQKAEATTEAVSGPPAVVQSADRT
jgi:succinate dehydrogenase / fumarate reductase cytochrome b subunit